jgi:UDPglucose 6-dehydrogenase
VGTLDPSGSWTADAVERVVDELARDKLAPRTIVLRSTLMPGTSRRIAEDARAIDPAMDVAHNPEFMRQGSAVADFMRPSRVVIGATSSALDGPAVAATRRFYAGMDAPTMVTDSTSAELIKIGSNVYLSMKVGFANEIARLALATGADVATVVDGIGLDGRIGRSYLSPGPGFGGSCLPSQSRALPGVAADGGVQVPIIAAVARSNEIHSRWVVEQLARAVGDLRDVPITVLGLAFKAGTDDCRESPAVAICAALYECGAALTVHDPLALAHGLDELARVSVGARSTPDAEGACASARAVVVATEWPLYGALDWARIAPAMSGNVVLDTRAIVDVDAATGAGLAVYVHGRPATPAT